MVVIPESERRDHLVDHDACYHPIHIDVRALYNTLARSMAFEGKEAKHRTAVT